MDRTVVAIIGQVFYNIECGRYALYCGEPVFTAFFVLRNNLVYLPKPLRPGWPARIGMTCCGLFYLGFAALVFYQKQLPLILNFLSPSN